jgi:hypothetical protein
LDNSCSEYHILRISYSILEYGIRAQNTIFNSCSEYHILVLAAVGSEHVRQPRTTRVLILWHVCVCVCVCVCVHRHIHIYICTYIHIYVPPHIPTYAYYTHTHTHTYTQRTVTTDRTPTATLRPPPPLVTGLPLHGDMSSPVTLALRKPMIAALSK